jgi:hypothetical protein
MKQKLFDEIISSILSSDVFYQYKYRKSSAILYHQNDDVRNLIILEHWREKWGNALVISPIYGVRFEILHKWSERFTVLPLRDLRWEPSFKCSGTIISEPTEFLFEKDWSNFDTTIRTLLDSMIKCSDYVFKTYSTLYALYDSILQPFISETKNLYDVGAEWIFDYMSLCFLVAPEHYKEFKKKILNHIEWMHGRHEPNVARYYGRYDEIFSYMEANLKLPNGYPSLG